MKNRQNDVRRGMLMLLSLTMVCVMALVGGSLSGVTGNGVSAAMAEIAAAVPEYDPSPAIYVAEKNINSVVGVLTNEQRWNQTQGVINELVSQGSGVVIADGGYILTNSHVVEGGSAYQILMPSGEKVDAELIGADTSTDLAVLQVSGDAVDQLIPVTFGSTEMLKVGSTVIAIGNPGGEVLANTVTQGIVSALERTSVTASGASRRISYIQHDASINSGNSGGGLFNYRGELVGINTLKYSGSAYSSVTFEGLGFAIPIETVHDIALQLIEHGRVIRPGLGITAADQVGPDEPLNNNAPASVVIHSVNPDGAADKAGLKQYDFIYEVDGVRVTCMLDLTGVLDQHEAGDVVTVKVIRYNQAGMYQPQSSIFNYGFGYSFGYGNGSASAELVVGGGYQEITVDVTLEVLQAE